MKFIIMVSQVHHHHHIFRKRLFLPICAEFCQLRSPICSSFVIREDRDPEIPLWSLNRCFCTHVAVNFAILISGRTSLPPIIDSPVKRTDLPCSDSTTSPSSPLAPPFATNRCHSRTCPANMALVAYHGEGACLCGGCISFLIWCGTF